MAADSDSSSITSADSNQPPSAPINNPGAMLASPLSDYAGEQLSPDQIAATKADLASAAKGERELTQRELSNSDQQFQQPAPQQGNLLGGLAPLLLFSAFGGGRTKANASAMIGATTGVVTGYLSGKQEAYDDAVAKYNQSYKAFMDHQAAQDKVYKEMREAYKGRIDADIKALQFARQVTGDEGKMDAQILNLKEKMDAERDKMEINNEQVQLHFQQMGLKLDQLKIQQENADTNKKREADTNAHNERSDAQRSTNESDKVAKDDKKTKATDDLVAGMNADIDSAVTMITNTPRTAGVGGMARSAYETVSQGLGANTPSTAHLVDAKLKDLQLKLAQYEKLGGRPSKDVVQLVEKMIGGQHIGQSDKSTVDLLKQLKDQINTSAKSQAPAAPASAAASIKGPDKDKQGQPYKIGDTLQYGSQTATYQGGGQWSVK